MSAARTSYPNKGQLDGSGKGARRQADEAAEKGYIGRVPTIEENAPRPPQAATPAPRQEAPKPKPAAKKKGN